MFWDWMGSPLIVLAAIAVISSLVTIGIWVGRVNSDRDSFKEFMKEIRDDIKRIFERLPPVTLSTGSPRRLNELGLKVAKKTKASDWANRLAPQFLERIKGKNPGEIEDYCYQYVLGGTLEKSDPLQMSYVLDCSYELGVAKEEVLKVLWVVLRDELLNLTQKNV
jgi:hypothetical protein